MRHYRILLLVAGAAIPGAIFSQNISHTYPPTEDIRKPDRTLSTGEGGTVRAIAYSPNGRLLAVAGGDGNIRLWDARPGESSGSVLTCTLAGNGAPVAALMFAGGDSNSLVSVVGQNVKTWDVSTCREITDATIRWEDFVALAIAPGREPILAEISEKEVVLWNYQTRTKIAGALPEHIAASCLAFSPDGKLLATASDDGMLHLWSLQTGKSVREVRTGSGVRSLAVGPTYIACGNAAGEIKLWAIAGGDEPKRLQGRERGVNSLAFSSKGEQLASGGWDKVVRVWDVETGALLCQQTGHTGEIFSVAFSPNGQKMASAGAGGAVNYWTVPLPPVPPDDLAKIKAALPAKATATPKRPRRILVFWRADAILHKGGVPAANHAIEWMGKKTGAFETDFSRDFDALDPKVLAHYDALVMNSTAHLAIPESAKAAYLQFATNGGGVVGIHAAIDTFRDWPEGAQVIGATFGNHPWHPDGTWAVKLEEPEHPLLRAFGGKNFKIRDEFYEMWDPFTRADRRVLLSVDFSDAATAAVKVRRPDHDAALAWVKRYGAGRVFYCDFGHIGGPFQNPAVLQFYLDGIQYALGDLAVDDAPRTEKKP